MLSPFDLIKGYLTLKSYFPWFCFSIILFGVYFFIKRKMKPNTTNWKGNTLAFLIIIGVLSLIFLFCFKQPQEKPSQHVGQLITKIDKAIEKYDDTINNYHGLKKDWEEELRKCEAVLDVLYQEQEITQEQKTKIKEALTKNEAKIKEIKEQLKDINGNITILKGKLIALEKEHADKEKEIEDKKRAMELASPDDKIRLKAEIQQLQTELLKLVEKIGEVKTEIRNLESEKKKYEGMLKRANQLKETLEREFDNLTSDERKLFAKIKTAEEHKTEIQKNIDELDVKIAEIKTEQELYKTLKTKYREMHNRLITYEKEHEATAGNIVNWAFKAFDKVTDLFPPKFALKMAGKTIEFTRKFSQGMIKACFIIREGHFLYNEIKNIVEGTPQMITKEVLDSYLKDIDNDLARLESDKQDKEKTLATYKQNRDNNQFLNTAVENEETQLNQIRERKRTTIDEYEKIVFDIEKNINKTDDKDKLETKQELLEGQIEENKEETIIKKEELQNKNPSYERVQQRIKEKRKQKRLGRIPEMVAITKGQNTKPKKII